MPLYKRLSGGNVQLVYNAGASYKYIISPKASNNNGIANYFELYHGNKEAL